jgi:hypothetical protein
VASLGNNIAIQIAAGSSLKVSNLKIRTRVIFLFLSLSDWLIDLFPFLIFWRGGSASSL